MAINDIREQWILLNKTSNKIILGELPEVPTIMPNGKVDLLQYVRKQDINQASAMISLIKSGLLELTKIVEKEKDSIAAVDGGDAVTSAEENELIEKVSQNQEITDDTTGILIFGEDSAGTAQPATMTGPENNQLQITTIDTAPMLEDIFDELIKLNMQMSILTGDVIKNRDISA